MDFLEKSFKRKQLLEVRCFWKKKLLSEMAVYLFIFCCSNLGIHGFICVFKSIPFMELHKVGPLGRLPSSWLCTLCMHEWGIGTTYHHCATMCSLAAFEQLLKEIFSIMWDVISYYNLYLKCCLFIYPGVITGLTSCQHWENNTFVHFLVTSYSEFSTFSHGQLSCESTGAKSKDYEYWSYCAFL